MSDFEKPRRNKAPTKGREEAVSMIGRTDADMNALRNLGDQMKDKLGDSVILLVSALDGKVNLVAMATDAAMAKGAHAGNLIKEVAALVGGGGGGRPNMAQAGGKNPAGMDAAIEKAYDVITAQLG